VEKSRLRMRKMREFGLGKRSLEGIIMEEKEEMIKRMKNKDIKKSGFFNINKIKVMW
jgi:hypothetical protein